MKTWQSIVTAAFAVTTAAFALACGPDDTAADTRPDLFRVAVDGLPGGSLLSVYGDPNAGRAYLSGGFVGVDPARLDAQSAGRLLVYRHPGTFTTLCAADAVLWWTAPVDGAPWAAGERGRVVRYREGVGCEAVATGLTFPEGEPTYWGFTQVGNVTWFVGGSASPTGPKGVLVRYDGSAFTRVEVPPEAREVNLYKVSARSNGQLVVVGERGVAFRVVDGAAAALDPTRIEGSDNRLFTVSCQGTSCWAVGGQNTGVVLMGTGQDGLEWQPRGFEDARGWNGVWFADDSNAFLVGVNGQTMHTNGLRSFLARSLTPATLHGVGGWVRADGGIVAIAVGGELDTADLTQRAVILLRGDDSAAFTVDGRAFVPTGELRRSLGGAGQ
ncbi:MAG: hypothetical protein Q8S73_10135 [Deltaproteobacteria bacterium]|nr:hypothetical protein [Myxococcales bacterium]MDP3214452.1 hypothetical protein [Deltaproteobacteria bacterium]